MNGNQVLVLPRLRPVRSIVAAAPASNGVGVSYGMGIGAVRVAGISYSIHDASGQYAMNSELFIARIAVLNGDYPYDATQFTTATDLTSGPFDVLFDRMVSLAQDTIATWFSGMATDDGTSCSCLISQIFFPTSSAAPPGIQPRSTLLLHADHYQSRELALSQGSIFQEENRGLIA